MHVGANRALFILGKYYDKLDKCEVYPITTSEYSLVPDCCIIHSYPLHAVLTPTKMYCWFKKNAGWHEEWKQALLDMLHCWWLTDYKPKPERRASPRSNPASHEPEPSLNVHPPVYPPSYELIWSTCTSHTKLQLLLWILIVMMMPMMSWIGISG